MLTLRRIRKTVIAAVNQMTQLVGGHPFALVVGKENLVLRVIAPADRIAKTIGDLLWFLARAHTNCSARPEQRRVCIGRIRENKGSATVADQAVPIVVRVCHPVGQRDDAFETIGYAVAPALRNS